LANSRPNLQKTSATRLRVGRIELINNAGGSVAKLAGDDWQIEVAGAPVAEPHLK